MRAHYSKHYIGIDFRKHPERYRIGRGEQGVLIAEPYKSEILPHWKFRTPAIARRSAAKIYLKFCEYRKEKDFVGMDMARKFLQMGYTRARRYANHRSGRKYDSRGRVLPLVPDKQKAKAAEEFYSQWQRAAKDPTYLRLKNLHRSHLSGLPQ